MEFAGYIESFSRKIPAWGDPGKTGAPDILHMGTIRLLGSTNDGNRTPV